MPAPTRSTPHDPFLSIYEGTVQHRKVHGCNAYPFKDGPSLGVLAAASGARRILELGTALGYTACCFAHGARGATIDTIERDPEHVRLARETFRRAGFADRMRVCPGDFEAVLPTLEPGYDIAFFDGSAPTSAVMDRLTALLRVGGVLVTSNLGHAGPDVAAVRAKLCDDTVWLTSFMAEAGQTAVSVKL